MAKIAEVIADILGPEFNRENVQNLADNVGSVVQKLNTTSWNFPDEMCSVSISKDVPLTTTLYKPLFPFSI